MGIEIPLENLERKGFVSFFLRDYTIYRIIVLVFFRMEISHADAVFAEDGNREEFFCQGESKDDIFRILERFL